MKRYRITSYDFDTRPSLLGMDIPEHWDEAVKEQHRKNKESLRNSLKEEFGSYNFEQKARDFIDLGNAFPTVVAFHNDFLRQCRHAFVMGSYYPALTGITTLTERVLNHLIFLLRNSFKGTDEYREVQGDQIDNWDKLIRILTSWDCLLPECAAHLKDLKQLRHRYAAHFNRETDTRDRELALKAMNSFQEFMRIQFGSFGKQPWIIEGTKGEFFIKKEYEKHPFVEKLYLPNSAYVGPYFKMDYQAGRWIVRDKQDYPQKEISDEEFIKLRAEFTSR